MQRHIDAGSFSGAVTLVARNGRIAYYEAAGSMDLEAKKPMTKDAMFRIMSMTKPVIGVATMMMIEEGKVRLQDPISKFIPEWANMTVAMPSAPPAPAVGGGRRHRLAATARPPSLRTTRCPSEREVTVRDLLTHTGGLVSGPMSNAAARKVAAGPERHARGLHSAARQGAARVPARHALGVQRHRGVRHAVSSRRDHFGHDDRQVREAADISIPLGMKDTTYIVPSGNPRLVKLYSHTAEGLKPTPDPVFMNGVYFSGGGGLVSTALDYAQFALMLANDGELNGVRLLSPRAVGLMDSVFAPDTLPGRPRGESFGLSMRVVNDPAARNSFLTQGSFGWSGAFGTHFWVDRKEKLVAIVMTQTSNREFLSDFENMVMQAVVD